MPYSKVKKPVAKSKTKAKKLVNNKKPATRPASKAKAVKTTKTTKPAKPTKTTKPVKPTKPAKPTKPTKTTSRKVKPATQNAKNSKLKYPNSLNMRKTLNLPRSRTQCCMYLVPVYKNMLVDYLVILNLCSKFFDRKVKPKTLGSMSRLASRMYDLCSKMNSSLEYMRMPSLNSRRGLKTATKVEVQRMSFVKQKALVHENMHVIANLFKFFSAQLQTKCKNTVLEKHIKTNTSAINKWKRASSLSKK